MTKAEELFHQLAAELPDATESKMFGALCLKAPNGKAGVMFWRDDMIFKLSDEGQREAMALEGAKIFDPMGGRPMNGWVHVPNMHSAKWKEFAKTAMENAKKIESAKKAKRSK